MLLTMVKRNVPLANIQTLINTQRQISPDYNYNMKDIVLQLAASDTSAFSRPPGTELETFRYLLRLSITDRLDLLDITKWRIDLEKIIGFFCDKTEIERETQDVYDRLDMYELAKEATSILELALWKHKMDESTTSNNVKSEGQRNKRARVDTRYYH